MPDTSGAIMHPQVSIIMPAYNASSYLSMAVESVIAQSYQSWELIIVEDCSRDNTGAIAMSYAEREPRIRLVQNKENCGASLSRHNGVQAAAGKWLAFLDSDDCWERDKLEKQLQAAEREHAKIVFTASAFMDGKGNLFDYTLHVPQTIEYRQLCKQNLISNSSALVDKELFMSYEVVGSGIHEDFACWLNILKDGYIAYGIDEPLLIYRLTPSSKSGNKLHAARMNWNTYRVTGMNVLKSLYYMCWYTLKGIMKYRHLQSSNGATI